MMGSRGRNHRVCGISFEVSLFLFLSFFFFSFCVFSELVVHCAVFPDCVLSLFFSPVSTDAHILSHD